MKSMKEFGLRKEVRSRDENCEQHGQFVSRNYLGNIWSRCPACEAIREEQARIEKGENERAKRLEAWQRKIGQSGIPERFHSRTLDTYIAETEGQRKALSFAQKYADEFDVVLKTGRSALFVGKTGTGKTHMACGIALQIMQKQHRTVLFTTVIRAIRRIKDTWAKGAEESEGQAVASFVEPDLLILDEIGVQFGTEFERNMLFDIINERYEKRRPTILMSNLLDQDVKAYLGERVIDRIREDGGRVVPFGWESHRGR